MVITALDFNNARDAMKLAQQLDPGLTRVKVGKELFTSAGPQLVEKLQQLGFDVFLDLKFHDIPNTVAGAVAAAASLGVWMVNVHASGGPAMLDAARAAIPVATGESGGTRLIAVTVLTSMDDNELHRIGVPATAAEQVARLATLAKQAGLDGVVCSPREVTLVREVAGSGFLTVTPGVRPASGGVTGDDQIRVTTPSAAKAAGSDYLVIGRPITRATDPLQALREINAELAGEVA